MNSYAVDSEPESILDHCRQVVRQGFSTHLKSNRTFYIGDIRLDIYRATWQLMQTIFKTWKQFFVSITLLLIIFSTISALYILHTEANEKKRFQTHALIVANGLHSLCRSGVTSYLQLIARLEHYKSLTVQLSTGEPFILLTGPPLSAPERIFSTFHLLPLTSLSTDIVYKGQVIGTLKGRHYSRLFYPLLTIFSLLLVMMLAGLYLFNLLDNRKLLKHQIFERTKKFRESERRFEDLVNLLPEMVCESDLDGTITYANALALERFKRTESDLGHITIFDQVIPEHAERIKESVIDLIQGQPQEHQEFTASATDGTTFPILTRSAPIYTNGQISGVRTVIIDITERHILEEKLHRAQKMEIIGLMAGGVAHDLNNILSGIVNYPELILMKLPKDSELRDNVNAIRKSGLQAAEIVADMLTVSRGVAASKVVANPNELIQEYLDSPEFIQLQKIFPELVWKVHLEKNIGNILCSTTHFRKSLMNLITNAAESITGIGQVSISTLKYRVDDKEHVHNNLAKGTYCVVSISDTGPGISPEDLEHIFEPFYTKKIMGKSGTGLGLTVVWNTMMDHDGEVQVESDSGGTTFSLSFPVTSRPVEQSPSIDELEPVMGNGETVLVIDDDRQQQKIARLLLESLNYRPTTVSSGEEAVEYLKDHAVDVLLLDMLMPPGMNGLETYRQILTIHPEQKAILASGFSESEDVKKALELGASFFIKKPYVIDKLAVVLFSTLL